MAKKKNALEALRRYFQPTEKTRLRDVFREMPGAALNVAKEIPKELARFGLSTAEAPETILRGGGQPKFTRRALGGTNQGYNLPLLGNTETYQDQQRQIIPEVLEGRRMLGSALLPGASAVMTGAAGLAGAGRMRMPKVAKGRALAVPMERRIVAQAPRVNPKYDQLSQAAQQIEARMAQLRATGHSESSGVMKASQKALLEVMDELGKNYR